MKRVIKASTGSPKVTGRTWRQFIANLESETSYEVDSVDRERYSQWITLLKGSDVYDAEVTKYSDGTYELILSNITKSV